MIEIKVEVEGLDELQTYLDGLIDRLSEEFWHPILLALSETVRFDHMWGISPVITGSYRGSHRTVVGGMQSVLSVDPSARNTDSGILVTRYMVPVEERHFVYARSFAYAERLLANRMASIGRMIIGEH